MNRVDRERAIAIINQHIEQGKQFIRDKRLLIDIIHNDIHARALKFRWPWKDYTISDRDMALNREIDRAWMEIERQKAKNSQLRDLRETIMVRAMPIMPTPILLAPPLKETEAVPA